MANREAIDRILKETMRLSDDSIEKIFTANQCNRNGNVTYNCQLCQVSCMSQKCLMIHIAGRKHEDRLTVEAPQAEEFRRHLGNKQNVGFMRK